LILKLIIIISAVQSVKINKVFKSEIMFIAINGKDDIFLKDVIFKAAIIMDVFKLSLNIFIYFMIDSV